MNTGYSIDSATYNRLLAHVEKTIRKEEMLIKVLNWLLEQLKSYEGKVLNKRIESAIKDDSYYVSYSKRYNYHYLYVAESILYPVFI
jgi:RNA binding exosome subunit